MTAFVYGTLLSNQVVTRLLGRVPLHTPATLDGYARYRIKGQKYPALVVEADAQTTGRVFEGLTEAELCKLDGYEGIDPSQPDFATSEYKRIGTVVQTAEGAKDAFAYVWGDQFRDALEDAAWDFDAFMRDDFQAFWGEEPDLGGQEAAGGSGAANLRAQSVRAATPRSDA